MPRPIAILSQLKKATPELRSVVYVANSSFKGCKEMSALPHVTSSSLEEIKVKKLAGKIFPSPKQQLAKTQSMVAARKGTPLRVSGSGAAAAAAAAAGDKGDVVAAVEEEEEEATVTVEEMFNYSQKHILRVCESYDEWNTLGCSMMCCL